MAEMNKALLAKVGWRLIHDDHSLWAKVLRSKYKVKDTLDLSWLTVKGTWSSTWRSVCVGLREVVIPGINWVIGDGKSIRFWQDKWLIDEPLCKVALLDIPNGFENLRVVDYWKNGTGWTIEAIDQFVRASLITNLWALVVDAVTGARDRLSWGESSSGQFTVSSAYSLFTRDSTPRQDMGNLFSKVWRVVAPERVQVFLWLGVNQVIMTNVERRRRHLSVSGMCQVCKGGDETIIHILRDCPAMEGVWLRLVPQEKRHDFFTKTLLE